MADVSLLQGYPDFLTEAGIFLGIGDSPAGQGLTRANLCIKGGLSKFYRAYNWGFLQPTTTLTTTAADEDQDLPDDFGHQVDTGLTFAEGTNRPMITWTHKEHIQRLRTYDISSHPIWAAVRPKVSTGAAGSKAEIMFYPTPDDAYVLTYTYRVLQNNISASSPYPYGYQEHSDTILEFILAECELKFKGGFSSHYQASREALAESVAMEVRREPNNIGVSLNRSDETFERPRYLDGDMVYNGS